MIPNKQRSQTVSRSTTSEAQSLLSVATTHSPEQPVSLFSPARSIDNILLADKLSQTLGTPCQLLSQLSNQVSTTQLLLIDCQEFSANKLQLWLSQFQQDPLDNHQPPPLALMNASRGGESQHERLIEWPQVKGLFYKGTPTGTLLKGLRHILQGNLWFPRQLCEQFLQRHRHTPSFDLMNSAPVHFTPREKQMLEALYNGLSNAAIAQQMNLSEHTVKSHLYSVYKKVGVGSRLQMSNWLRDYYYRYLAG